MKPGRQATRGRRASAGLAWSLAIVVLAGGCERDPSARAELEPVPQPGLEGLDEGLRERVGARRAHLEELLDRSTTTPRELARAFGTLGELYLALDFLPAATSALGNAQALDPTEHRWPYYEGHARIRGGELQEARQAFERALVLHSEDLAARLHLARALLQAGESEAAAAELRRVLTVWPDAALALYLLGQAQLDLDLVSEAATSLARALELDPDASLVHAPLSQAYRRLGDTERAARHAAALGNAMPGFPDPLMEELEELLPSPAREVRRGVIAFRGGRFERAVEHYERALALDPEHEQARLNLAAALASLGQQEHAAEQLRDALRRNPQNAATHFNLGTLLAEKGRHQESIHHFREALRLEPGHAPSHQNLANELRRLGDCAAARRHYEQALAARPNDEAALYGQVRCLAAMGRSAEALALLEESPTIVESSLILSQAFARLVATSPGASARDRERALAAAQRAFQAARWPQHAEAVAMTLAALGRFEEAIGWQEGVLRATQQAELRQAAEALSRDLERYRRRELAGAAWSWEPDGLGGRGSSP